MAVAILPPGARHLQKMTPPRHLSAWELKHVPFRRFKHQWLWPSSLRGQDIFSLIVLGSSWYRFGIIPSSWFWIPPNYGSLVSPPPTKRWKRNMYQNELTGSDYHEEMLLGWVWATWGSQQKGPFARDIVLRRRNDMFWRKLMFCVGKTRGARSRCTNNNLYMIQ